MVSACTLREVKAARDAIKYKEDEVLNYSSFGFGIQAV